MSSRLNCCLQSSDLCEELQCHVEEGAVEKLVTIIVGRSVSVPRD